MRRFQSRFIGLTVALMTFAACSNSDGVGPAADASGDGGMTSADGVTRPGADVDTGLVLDTSSASDVGIEDVPNQTAPDVITDTLAADTTSSSADISSQLPDAVSPEPDAVMAPEDSTSSPADAMPDPWDVATVEPDGVADTSVEDAT
ncbi:MAG: hypothetical protein QF464_02700, partial [Myxococcota bacterium]|nr:hypothetical protein [Myxococcota bacterium]